MEDKLTVAELMMFVEEDQLDWLELYNQVEQLTHGFQLDRLKILAKHVEYYIYNRTDELEWQYRAEIAEEIKNYRKENKPLPLLQFKKPGPDAPEGAHKFYEETSKTEVIKHSALLPMEAQLRIFALKMLKNFITNKIRQQTPGAKKISNGNGQDRKYTVRQVALFYHYAQTVGELPHFERMAETKKAAYKQEAAKLNISPNTLEQNINLMNKSINRIDVKQVENIQAAIRLLESYKHHKAVELAQKELRQAESK